MIKLIEKPAFLILLSYLDRIIRFVLYRSKNQSLFERNLADFYERVWREAAASVGATVELLGHGFMQIRRGEIETKVHNHRSAIDGLVSHYLTRTKPLAYELLSARGLPIPRYLQFSLREMEKASIFLESVGAGCVVKPASDTGGGLGVTTRIRSRAQLIRAACAAARFGTQMIIEEQLDGDNYRLLYLDGRLVDAVVRMPPRVVGDGKSSMRQLVRKTNSIRLREREKLSHTLVTVDMDMQQTLASQGLSLNAVPRKDVPVILKTAINENCATDNMAASHLLCDAIIHEGSKAALAVGVRLAGVDIITKDPQVSLAESGGVILEVNSPPGYYWHYHRNGEPFPLAVHVLETLLRDGKPEEFFQSSTTQGAYHGSIVY